jgi:hypothetical protein
MPCPRPRSGLLGLAVPLAALALGAPAGRAEDLPHWKPDLLTLYADLVVLATQESATGLRIEKVLAGKWQGKQLQVPSLARFRKEPGRGGGGQPPAVTARCVAFLKGQRGKGVVANGVYRVQRDGSVLGYAQDHNPGGYELQAEPVYPSLDALLKAVAAAEAAVPRRKEALLRQLAAEQRFDLVKSHLDELRRIVRPDDQEVLAFVGRQLARGGENARAYSGFLQNLHEPGAYSLLKQHFERTGDLSLLYSIGHQGTPEARKFLVGLARDPSKGQERRRFALEGLASLYQAVEQADDARTRVKVREAIITLYDKDPFVAHHAAGHPRFLGVIPHPEAIQRLAQILARVRGDGTNREYEVERALRDCRRKLAERRKAR